MSGGLGSVASAAIIASMAPATVSTKSFAVASATRCSGEGRSDETGRLETFADGVMAIAITLLILEVRIRTWRLVDWGAALVRQWPSYAGFVVSFLTIGIIWVNHHHMFKLIGPVHPCVPDAQRGLLMTICVLPWPTAWWPTTSAVRTVGPWPRPSMAS